MNIERLTTPWWALRVALGAAAFLAGLDKFFNAVSYTHLTLPTIYSV